MGSFVKGWIWIWLFSNTLSLGLSLLWELASRTYRQPTKGYTAGKVIPKADLWISHQTNWSFLFRKRLNVGFFNSGSASKYLYLRWIYLWSQIYGTRGLKIKWKYCTNILYFIIENGNSLLKLIQLHFCPPLLIYSIYTIQPFFILISYRDRPTVNALLLIV